MKEKALFLSFITAGALLGNLLNGCVSATATRSIITPTGTTNRETIVVTGFLEQIQQGNYSTADGMTLSVSAASPDDQAIATLSSGVIQLGTAAMALAAKTPTNAVPAPSPALKSP